TGCADQAVHRRRPTLDARVRRADVPAISAPVVAGFGRWPPNQLTGSGIAQVVRVLINGRGFLNVENLEAGSGRVDVRHVLSVTVIFAGNPEMAAIVVDRHAAVDDLVLAVAVDVADAQIVEASSARPVPLPHAGQGSVPVV